MTPTSLPPSVAFVQGLRESEVLALTPYASTDDQELVRLGNEFCRLMRIFVPVYADADPADGSPTAFDRSVASLAEEQLAPGTTVATTIQAGSPSAAASAIGLQAVSWLCPEYHDLAPG